MAAKAISGGNFVAKEGAGKIGDSKESRDGASSGKKKLKEALAGGSEKR